MIFSGPCVLESEELALEIAETLEADLRSFKDRVQLIFKGSFDKANRSSFHSYRGPGLEKGLKILETVKKKRNLPVMTDFHLPDQAEDVASVCDVIQVPAFLCRQTDLVVSGAKACQKYQRSLKVKKGQFVSPQESQNIIKKASSFLSKDHIFLTERGFCFGYHSLIVDMSSFQTMKSFGVKAIYDATHSVQRPGGLGDTTGGQPEQILVLAKAAVAAGADGVFMEVHPSPSEAKSDAKTCLKTSQVKGIVDRLLKIYEVL